MTWFSSSSGKTVLDVRIVFGRPEGPWWHRHDISEPVREILDRAIEHGLTYLTARCPNDGVWRLVCDDGYVFAGFGAMNLALSPGEFGWLFTAWPKELRTVDDGHDGLAIVGRLLAD